MVYSNNLGQVRVGVRGWVAQTTTSNTTDADATLFVTAAGITDSTQISALNTLVTDLKTYGLWTKMKAIYPFVGGSAASHKWNLKDPRDLNVAFRLTFNGGGTHNATGYQPNGTNGSANTFLSPSANQTLTSSHFSLYSRTSDKSLSIYGSHGIYNSSSNCSYMIIRRNLDNYVGGAMWSEISGTGAFILSSTPDGRGLYMISRTSNNSLNFYKNGTSIISNTLTQSSTLPTNSYWLGGNNGTAYGDYDNKELAFASLGDGLTDTESSNFYISVQKFQTTLGRHVGTPYVSDPDAISFLMAAGITDGTQAAAINTLVIRMKADGVWTKMKAVYPFVGGTANSHKFNLKDPRDLDAAFRLVFNGGWAHSSTGALPNGTTGYADTKLNENSVMTLGSEHMSYYSRTNILGLYVDMGVWNASSNYGTQILTRHTYLSSDSFLGYVTDANSAYITNTDSRGFFMTNRPSISQLKLQKNSSIITFSSNVINKVNDNFWIGARNINSNSYLYSPRETAFASIGDGLTDTEASNLYIAVQAYQTTLGRQVNIPVVSDTDAQSFLNAANITSFQQASAVNKLVVDLKAAGVWTKMKAIYPFVGGSAASHKFNLKDPRDLDAAYRLVFNGGWTHTATGALPNGTTGYANTFFTPSSNFISNENAHISVYQSQPMTLSDMGGSFNSTSRTLFGANTTIIDCRLNSNETPVYVLSYNSDGKGLFTTTKNGSSQVRAYRNNTLVGTITAQNSSNPLNMFISARNGNGTPNEYESTIQKFISFGDGLTDTDATALYNSIQTYQTSLGRAVNTPVYNNGLVLNLDAGNANSYPGTGTTWFDLASGKNATLLNGPVYNSNNGGYLTLDGVNDRVDTTYTPGTFTNQTIIAWINKTNTQYCFILQKNPSPPFGFEIYPTTIYVCYGAFEAYTGYNPTGWHQVAYVYDGTQTGNSNRVKVYVNGILQNLTFGSNPPSSITINDVMQVGWRPWASLYSAVGISTLQMYNTSLSSTEILNNFNSTRGRFGL